MKKKEKILVGLSWGVDSAVAAYLLKEQGYEIVGGFMKNYLDEDNPNCTTKIDSQEAIKVARFLWIELISFDFIQEYEERIIQYIYESYEKWITPNPDILCNSLVKFDLFLEKAIEAWFDKVATGHYARILPPLTKEIYYSQTPPFNSIPPTPLNEGGASCSQMPPLKRGDKGGIRFLPYNPELKENARNLRKNMTKAEKKLWFDCFKKMDVKILRQQPIDNYIVDFYIASKKLVIEVDCETHRSEEEIAYDKKRTKVLESFWLKVIRFTNTEIYENIEWVFSLLRQEIKNSNKPPLTPPNRRGIGITNSIPLERVGEYQLLRWIDYNKDQSYFLSGLNQYQLSKSLFPLWALSKPEVRKIAEKIWLPNASRKDSQGLCFIGNIKIRNFLSERLKKKEWDIILTDWTVVGKHQWAYFFTIWQSRGLDINKKAYVCKIDVKNNQLIVSYDRDDPLLYQQQITLKNWHWIWNVVKNLVPLCKGEKGGLREKNPPVSLCSTTSLQKGGDADTKEYVKIPCTAKIRYRHTPEPAVLEKQRDWTMLITFENPQWGIAPGQSIVAYDGEVCLGWWIIV